MNAATAITEALRFATQPSPGYLFALGDVVRSIDLLTRGVVDHRCVREGQRMYRIAYELWPNEPERQIWKPEGELLGKADGDRYWALYLADRKAGLAFAEETISRRG